MTEFGVYQYWVEVKARYFCCMLLILISDHVSFFRGQVDRFHLVLKLILIRVRFLITNIPRVVIFVMGLLHAWNGKSRLNIRTAEGLLPSGCRTWEWRLLPKEFTSVFNRWQIEFCLPNRFRTFIYLLFLNSLKKSLVLLALFMCQLELRGSIGGRLCE